MEPGQLQRWEGVGGTTAGQREGPSPAGAGELARKERTGPLCVLLLQEWNVSLWPPSGLALPSPHLSWSPGRQVSPDATNNRPQSGLAAYARPLGAGSTMLPWPTLPANILHSSTHVGPKALYPQLSHSAPKRAQGPDPSPNVLEGSAVTYNVECWPVSGHGLCHKFSVGLLTALGSVPVLLKSFMTLTSGCLVCKMRMIISTIRSSSSK